MTVASSFKTRALSVAAALALTTGVVSTSAVAANAAESASINELTINSTSSGVTTTLDLNFDHPASKSSVSKDLVSVGVDPDTLTVAANGKATVTTNDSTVTSTTTVASKATQGTRNLQAAAAGGPVKAYHYCNQTYKYSDDYGTVTWTHRCNNVRNDWTYNLGAATVAIAVGNVTEHGLSWTDNGKTGSRNVGHSEVAYYQFHGAMNPVYNNDFVTYWDQFDFRHNIAGGGSGQVTISGQMTLSAVTKPCAATDAASASTTEASPSGTC